jgi:hypothetical protein
MISPDTKAPWRCEPGAPKSALRGDILADWTREFDDPIPVSKGRQLVTLRGAADYIMKLPKAEQNLEAWQTAVEALLLVVELGGPTMMARIGMMRTLNRNVERVFNPSRKDKQWGKHELKRGE